jgi:hypothetical protein
LASDVDPSTPSTITQGDGDNSPVIRSPLAAQSLPQYWFVASTGADLFTISHLTSKKYLAYDKTTASSTQQGKIILQTNAYNWRFTNQRLGGYAIISAVDSNIAICMPVASSDVNGETFVADGTTGAQRQRWSLLRSGSSPSPRLTRNDSNHQQGITSRIKNRKIGIKLLPKTQRATMYSLLHTDPSEPTPYSMVSALMPYASGTSLKSIPASTVSTMKLQEQSFAMVGTTLSL